MSVTGWKSPGTITSESYPAGRAWTNPTNAASSNDQDASCDISKNDKPSYYLRCVNFGFTIGDVPEGAIIDGIEVDIECAAGSLSAIYDLDIFLRDASGEVGDDKPLGGTWGTADAYRTHGGASDTWNAGLDDADVRAATFGVDIVAANSSGGTVTAYIDHVRIRVYYTEVTAENIVENVIVA